VVEIRKAIVSDSFSIFTLHSPELPENTYLISSPLSRKILFNPHSAGKRLQDDLESAGEMFVRALGETVLKGTKLDNCCELVFLSGGLFYHLNHGFKKVYAEVLPQCFLGIKRARVENKTGQFTAYATYENFEALPDKATVIIGDTIATGATLQKGLQHLFDSLEEKNYTLDKLIILTLAGSTVGAKRFKEVERRIKSQFPEAKLHFFACEQLFHLMPDGTDLRFLEETSVMPEETHFHIIANYGEELGKNMKCAVFDWGTRCKNPKAHLHEFLEYCEEALKTPINDKTRTVLVKMKEETEESLKAFEKTL
jgi:hypothetical protein